MAAMDSCFTLLTDETDAYKHLFTHQLHTKHVVAVGWEL